MTELIGDNYGGNLSVKLAALQGLCLFSEVNKWSITCPVCNGSIRSKKQVSYDLHEPASQVETVGKYMVRLIRQHCEAVHPNTWVWNVVVPTRIKEDDGIEPFEHFLHQALKAGALHGYIPKALTAMEFCMAFGVRIGSALSWIRWSRMMNKRLNKLQRIDALREDATCRIRKISDIVIHRIMSENFASVLETHSLNQLFNKLMLFFCEMGRYRHCPIFGVQGNVLQAAATHPLDSQGPWK